MPKRPVSGTAQKVIELPVELVERVDQFRAGRGTSFKAEVVEALERHMAYPPAPPPPPVVTPLTPLGDSPTAKTPRKRKGA